MSGTRSYRIEHLDGLRGVAIVLVILFHAYSRWPRIVPYGFEFKAFPLFKNGWLGVELFFMISGFVILMSLERCTNVGEFLVKRWIRLFPAMFFCSMLIFLTAPIFPERPAGPVGIRDLLPGLTFIEPYWWSIILGSPQGEMEGAFWSLYVEVKLYIVGGIFYFWLGWKRMVQAMILLFLLGAALLFIQPIMLARGLGDLYLLLSAFSGLPCGWFASGALFYRYSRDGDRRVLLGATLVGVAAALAQARFPQVFLKYQWDAAIAGLIIVSLFFLACTFEPLQRILRNKVLLFVGFISYPLYLIHENMLVSLIVKLGVNVPSFPPLLLPFLPALLLGSTAWVIARWLEQPTRRFLKSAYFRRADGGARLSGNPPAGPASAR